MNDKESPPGLGKEFLQTTSMHGVRVFTDPAVHWARRFFWCIISIGMVSGVTYIIWHQVLIWIQFPYYSKQSFRFDAKTGIDFPAVTICSFEQIRKSDNNDSIMMSEFLAYIFRSDTTVSKLNFSDPVLRHKATPIDLRSLLLDSVLKKDELFVECEWKGIPINCSKYITQQFTNMGLCYTFNSRKFHKGGPRKLVSHKPGAVMGLDLVLNVHQEKFYRGFYGMAGVKVRVHDPWEIPDMKALGFVAMLGQRTFAAMRKSQYRALPPPFNAFVNERCIDTRAEGFVNPLKLYDVYSHNQCYAECELMYLIEKCSCQSVLVDLNISALTLCSMLDVISCYLPEQDIFRSLSTEAQGCDCEHSCDWNDYQVQISSGQFPSLEVMKTRQYTTNDTRNNILGLSVYFEHLITDQIEQVPAYAPEDVIANLGGQFGVFLGASFITLVEISEFIIRAIAVMYIRIKGKIKTTSTKVEAFVKK